MENPIKIHDLGVPLFLETPKSALDNLSFEWHFASFFEKYPRIRRREMRDGSKGDDNVTTPIAC